MKTKKILGLLLSAAMIAGMMTGCGESSNNGSSVQNSDAANSEATGSESVEGDEEKEANIPFYMTLDPEVSGEIDVMTWSGDGLYHEDLGHLDLSAEDDLKALNVAAVYAMAKKFNEMYPNIKINLYSKAEGGNDGETTWSQEMENFKYEHGKYPDIYTSANMADDTARGMVADLSVYADDPLYQMFNSSVMSMMNYYGLQAGLPQFMQPWGIYVNKELAENYNIDVPEADWTIDEYTDFVTSADNTTFWGLIYGSASQILETGVDTVAAALAEGTELDIASEQVMKLLDYVPQWTAYEIWARNSEGGVDSSIMDDGWWWSFRFFCRNYCLTSSGDPWMMSAAAIGQNEDGSWATNSVESNDWDIYPRPSTDYRGNNVGIVIDPMCLSNFAMSDGDSALSDAEKAQMDLAYAFASFWCGSTEAMQARADQKFNDQGTIRTCLNDSFPLVTGEAFDEQMQIWYSTDNHKRYGDAELMPGFQYVVELWEQGQIWSYADKCYPCFVYVDGTKTDCLYEWNNLTNADVVGVAVTDSSWLDTVKANLPEWNVKTKERFAEAEKSLKDGLKTYYGYTDSDF